MLAVTSNKVPFNRPSFVGQELRWVTDAIERGQLFRCGHFCGCTSVIVPGFFRDRSEWVASHPLGRVGVAYGLDDLDHARQTRSQVQGVLDAQEQTGLDTVRLFISTTQAGFSVT